MLLSSPFPFPTFVFFIALHSLPWERPQPESSAEAAWRHPPPLSLYVTKKRKRAEDVGARPKTRPTAEKASGAEQCETPPPRPSTPVAKACGQQVPAGGYRRVPPPPPPKPHNMPKPWWPPPPPIPKKARPQGCTSPKKAQSKPWWKATGSVLFLTCRVWRAFLAETCFAG